MPAVSQYKSAQRLYLRDRNWEGYLHCQANIGQSLIYVTDFKVGLDTLRNGIKLYETRLSKQYKTPPEPYFWLRLNYTNGLSSVNQAKEALNLLKQLLPEVEAAYPDKYSLLGRIHLGMAFAAFDLTDYVPAHDYAAKTIQVFGKNLQTEWGVAVYSYLVMARVKDKLYDYRTAMYYYKEMDKVRPTKISRGVLAIDAVRYGELGGVYQSMGDYGRALDCYQQELALCKNLYGFKYKNTVNCLLHIGDIYRLKDDFNTAMGYYEKALIYVDSMYQTVRNERAILLSNIAECKSSTGRWMEAIETWQRAIGEAQNAEGQAYVPLVRESLARFYLKNSNLDGALNQLQMASTALDQQKERRFLDLSRIKTLLASAFLQKKDFTQAMQFAQQSLVLQCRPGTALSEAANPQVNQILLSNNTLPTLLVKANILYEQWRALGGDIGLLSNALQTCQHAIQVGEQFRQYYQRSSEENYEWIKQYKDIFTRGIASAYHLYKATDDRAYLQQAFSLADRNKAMLLSDGLHKTEAKAFSGLPKELLEREAELRRQITYYEQKAMVARSTPGAEAEAEQQEASLFIKKRAFDALSEQIERDYPYYFEQKYRPRLVNVRDIQGNLTDKSLFLEYTLDETDQQLYIFTIGKKNGLAMSAHTLPREVSDQVSTLYNLLQSVHLVRPEKRQQFVQLSHRLYNTFIKPVEDQIVDKQKLYIIGEGMLQYLPFDLLLSDNVNKPFADLPYLFRRFEISYQYSGTMLVRQHDRQKSKSQKGVLLFAPNFDSARVAALERGASTEDDFRYRFEPLPFSQKEVENINGIYGHSQAVLLSPEQSTEAMLKQHFGLPYRIIHIASHSFTDLKNPRFSGIACAIPRSVKEGEEDGILYANELYNCQINADLVVLSSCKGGMGQLNNSEGALGLHRACIYAGASNIVYSLWNVQDQVVSRFMAIFHLEISEGKSYAAALRNAKLSMLTDEMTSNPVFWGGLLLIGQ